MIQGAYSYSIELAEKAISYFRLVENNVGIADAKYTIAGALYKTDDLKRGLQYLIDCLHIYQRHEDYHNQARVRKSIGTIYEYYGDQQAAINAYEAAIEAGKTAKDLNLQSNAFNPLSGILLNQGKTEEAMELIELSISMKKETNDIRGLAFALYGRGKVYTETGDFILAEKDLLKSIDIHREMGEELGIGMSFHKIGALYLKMKDFQRADEMLKKALAYANEKRIALIKFKANYLLYQLYKEQGQLEQSMEFLEAYVKEKEFVIGTQTSKLIESYDAIARMEAKEAEIKVEKERSSMIEQKNLELDAFFYRVSHDLKGPITSLVGLDFVAREDLKDNKSIQYLDMFKEQILRINHIIDSLIKFTRSNHFAEVAEEIDFSEMSQECISSFNYLPNFGLIDFQVVVDQDVSLKAEWALVNTILQNLIENAIKYVRKDQEQPRVAVRIGPKHHGVLLTVEDNGLGMDEETRKNIFNMFYQGNEVIAGAGLGLYILKKSVDQLGGKLELDSQLNEGTTFRVFIPDRKF